MEAAGDDQEFYDLSRERVIGRASSMPATNMPGIRPARWTQTQASSWQQ